MNEYDRAMDLCKLARRDWKGRIHGFIRMEIGFEIILCSFEDHLIVDHIGKVSSTFEHMGSIANLQAIATRFDGVGRGRVAVNTDSFVTLFSNASTLYFDDRGLPRARNDTAVLAGVRQAVTDLVLSDAFHDPSDWQALADMVVARYSDRIATLAAGEFPNLRAFQLKVEGALRPFIDFAARNRTEEIGRCAVQHFQRRPDRASIASLAILNVTTTLCTALTEASEASSLGEGLAIVRRLKEWLAWTTWKRCRGCALDEVCFLPVWPLGGKEDFEHPRCISNMSEVSRGYWDVELASPTQGGH